MPTPAVKPPTKAKPRPVGYLANLKQLDAAGYGIIMTRTREPLRVQALLKEFTYSRRHPKTGDLATEFIVWDCVRGMVKHPRDTKYEAGQVTVVEKDLELLNDETVIGSALESIQDFKNFGKNAMKDAIVVFMYPHLQIKEENADFITIMKEYCKSIPAGRCRIILLTPEGFQLPSELEDDIFILDFGVPSKGELTERFYEFLDEVETKCPYDEDEVSLITSAGLGMTELDFDQSLSLAITETCEATGVIDASVTDFVKVMYRSKVEAVKRVGALELIEPIAVNEVGGLENAKAWALLRKDDLSPQAKEFGVDPPRGALFVGVPGSGKSLIARMMPSIFGLLLVRLDVGKIFNKYVGQSEATMDGIISFIKAISPVVVWIDELDKAGMNTSSENESSQRVLAKLLTFMQENTHGIIWIPTANDITKIPTELIRPGRLDKVFFAGLPTKTEREVIFNIHLRKRKQTYTIKDLHLAVDASDGYTGGEIESAVNEAVSFAFRNKCKVTADSLVNQIRVIKPQSISHKAKIDQIIEWGRANAVPASLEEAKEEGREVANPSPTAPVVLTKKITNNRRLTFPTAP